MIRWAFMVEWMTFVQLVDGESQVGRVETAMLVYK